MRAGHRALPLAMAGGLVVLLLAARAAAYGERVFNANPTYTNQGYQIYLGGRAAQSFTPASAFVLYNVTLRVQNVGGNGDTLNVTIQTDAGGSPSGTVLAGADQNRAGNGWLDFPLTPRPILSAATMYWIVAASAQSAGNGYQWFHANADVVPGQAEQDLGAGWIVTSNTDLSYLTYGAPLEPEIAVGLGTDRSTADAGGTFAYAVYLNNSGVRAPTWAWVNLTLPPQASYVADNASSLGGVPRGPTKWFFTAIANGPHVFGVTVVVALGTPVGTVLTGSVHLDYADSFGRALPGSTDTARVMVGLKQKPMYLAFDGVRGSTDVLQAAAPTGLLSDFDGDGIPGLTLRAGQNASWILAPAIARPLHLLGAVGVTLFMDSKLKGDSVSLDVTLYDRGATITPLASVSRTVTFNALTDYEGFVFDLGALDHWIDRGNRTQLEVYEIGGGDIYIAYNSTTLPWIVPSVVSVTTDTYVSIDTVAVTDARGPSAVFSPRDVVSVFANVSDPFGAGEIAGVSVTLIDPDGLPVVTNANMPPAALDPRTPPAWRTFDYTYGRPAKEGTYTFAVSALEGNGVRVQASGSFVVRVPLLSLAVTQDVLSAAPPGLVHFTIYLNNTGTGNATAWLNVTLPSGLTYVSDTAVTIGGTRSGESRWTVPDLAPGNDTFQVVVRMGSGPAAGAHLGVRFDMAYADEKGFPWSAAGVSLDVLVLAGPPPPLVPGGTNPAVFLLLAAAIAAPPIGYGVWRRKRAKLEEVFLVHAHGVLLCHLSRRMRAAQDKDDDVLGAMLTVVQNFVRDSFRYEQNRDLDRVEFGSYRVLIERGDYVYLAAAFSGKDSPEVRKKLRRTIQEVETKFQKDLADFSGEMEPLLGVRDIVSRLIRQS